MILLKIFIEAILLYLLYFLGCLTAKLIGCGMGKFKVIYRKIGGG